MNILKRFLSLTLVVLIFIFCVAAVMEEFRVFQRAFIRLESFVCHPSIETESKEEK